MRRAAAFAILTLAAPALVTAQGPKSGFLERTVRMGDTSHAYKVWVPPRFDGGRSWPVILFLHGRGEAGTDGVQQTRTGLGPVLLADPERFPAVVVFPQAPPGQLWLGDTARVATTALEQTVAEFGGDPDRIYVAGLSMGAYGAWVLAFEHPERYAAIVSVAGGIVPPRPLAGLAHLPPTLQAGDPYAATAARVKGIPAWLFHGADDSTVPVTESRRIVAALQKVGASPRYTEYAGVGHNSWDRAFAETDLPKWLLAQQRRARSLTSSLPPPAP